MKSIIHIGEGDCANCYQCIRRCPTQAIAVNNFKASIIDSKCIECGQCIDICPQNLIEYVSHVDVCRNIIKTNDIIIASIAPSWIGEFYDVTENKIVEALKLLGFTHISETTLGAEVVIKESCQEISYNTSIERITSMCPVVSSLIKNKYPKLISNLIPIDTPSVVHTRQLKQLYGTDAKIITISSCVAAKREVYENDGLIDASITFNELKEWLKSESISFNMILGHSSYEFEPKRATAHSQYVLQGGVFSQQFINTQIPNKPRIFSSSGLDSMTMDLNNLNRYNATQNTIIEMWSCRGGCLNGFGSSQNESKFLKIDRLINYSSLRLKGSTSEMPYVPFEKKFQIQDDVNTISDTTIINIIQSLLIDTSKELIDCGGCGYFECKEFAKQVALGYAHREMCVWLQQNLAKETLSTLLDNMNSGIAIIDSSFKIVKANNNFGSLIGLVNKAIPRFEGLNIKEVTPFIKDIDTIFETKNAFREKDIQIKDKLVKVSIVKLTSMNRAIIIIRNLFSNDVQSDEIINRTRSVINDNLKTVQQIAYLLGETASKTEAVLNSIIESQTDSNGRK